MTQTSQTPHEKALKNVLLPSWMRFAVGISALALAGLLLLSLADGADKTPIEQSPYRSVPEGGLTPGG